MRLFLCSFRLVIVVVFLGALLTYGSWNALALIFFDDFRDRSNDLIDSLCNPSPSASPSPTPESAYNFAVVPDDWDLTGINDTLPATVDTEVLHDGHVSIKNVKQGNLSREILCYDKSRLDKSFPVSPGDHVVFKIWMKTSAQYNWRQ